MSVTFCNHIFQVSQSQGSWASPWHSLERAQIDRWTWSTQLKKSANSKLPFSPWTTHSTKTNDEQTNHTVLSLKLSELTTSINWPHLPHNWTECLPHVKGTIKVGHVLHPVPFCISSNVTSTELMSKPDKSTYWPLSGTKYSGEVQWGVLFRWGCGGAAQAVFMTLRVWIQRTDGGGAHSIWANLPLSMLPS